MLKNFQVKMFENCWNGDNTTQQIRNNDHLSNEYTTMIFNIWHKTYVHTHLRLSGAGSIRITIMFLRQMKEWNKVLFYCRK